MYSSTFLAIASLTAVSLSATVPASSSLPTATSKVSSLNELARARGKLYFGSATDNPEFTDTAYVKLLTGGMFGQMTASNAMKWGPTEPELGVFNFTEGDQVLHLAKSHGIIMRGHNLAWDSQLPDFFVNNTFDAPTLVSILRSHIHAEVTHFKGQMYAWDVVNEPFADTGGMRDWFYQDVVGTSYINDAFHAAHAADPKPKLYINDYNLETPGAKFDTAVSIVKQLLQEGVPIHGIGFESHMIVGQVPTAEAFAAQMRNFTSLGLEVAVTELDIRMTLPETPAALEQQKADYEAMITGCMMVEKCVGMTVWDFTDKFSWIPGVFADQGAACPWDDDLIRKPAFDGIVAGLNSRH